MKTFLISFVSLALIASALAWPLENKENIALDTTHEAHQTAGSVEKPPQSDMIRLETIIKPETVGVIASETLPKETAIEMKPEPVAEPEAIAAVVKVPETPVEAQASERVIVQILPETAEAVVAVVAEPAENVQAVAGERAGRALYGYPYNNYAGYGTWANNDKIIGKYNIDSYGNYIPNVYTQGAYYPGSY